MKTTGHTVLITGGGSGIGFEIARLFAQGGNQVIITGRNREKLQQAAGRLKGVTFIPCDVTDEGQVNQLIQRIEEEFGSINVLINNAGTAKPHQLHSERSSYEVVRQEIETNFLAAVSLTEKFLPHLAQHSEAAVVNISSIVAYAPALVLPTYSTSKAALHSYTQILRLTLKASGIKVFEVLPPLVKTELSEDIPVPNKILPADVAEAFIKGFSEDVYEIRVGSTAAFYQLYLNAPEKALLVINGMAVA